MNTAEAVAAAAVVFEGLMVSVGPKDSSGFRTYTYHVTRVYKGEAPRQVRVRTTDDSDSCGMRLASGVVFGYGAGGELTTNTCVQPRPLDRSQLGPGTATPTPSAPAPTPTPTAAPGILGLPPAWPIGIAGLGGLGVVVALVLGRRRA